MSGRGRFVVLEGGEASGKTTQAALLARRLDAVLTREPGGTLVGERLRSLVLDPAVGAVDPRAETLMLLAARAQHVAEVVAPALRAGRDVVCDRYSGSTLAYQGAGRGLDLRELRNLSRWAAAGVEPDAVILLTVPAAVAAERRRGRADEADRIEELDETFFKRVDEGFAALAAGNASTWRVVDGAGAVD
ncbi:MAG TPA: dTMP kinase, partial [Acidimicrobiales bacterium]|nr:dTMP kinase [Acidimicrobiales bacterium]